MSASSTKKICMLGDFGVGKTSLVRRYVLSEFSPEYQTTLGVNVYKFSDDVALDGASHAVNMIIWDIEGGIGDTRLLDTYVMGAAGAIVVGDLTDDGIESSLAENAERFQRIVPGRPVTFAMNKRDLVSADAVPDGQALVERFGCQCVATSAATGEAVPELFRGLAARILQTGA